VIWWSSLIWREPDGDLQTKQTKTRRLPAKVKTKTTPALSEAADEETRNTYVILCTIRHSSETTSASEEETTPGLKP
jgi:hypothetical protein